MTRTRAQWEHSRWELGPWRLLWAIIYRSFGVIWDGQGSAEWCFSYLVTLGTFWLLAPLMRLDQYQAEPISEIIKYLLFWCEGRFSKTFWAGGLFIETFLNKFPFVKAIDNAIWDPNESPERIIFWGSIFKSAAWRTTWVIPKYKIKSTRHKDKIRTRGAF